MPLFLLEKITNDGRRTPGRGEAMHSDIWYDLAIRELSDLSDPATEKLVEAAADSLPVPPTDEESAPPDAKTAESAAKAERASHPGQPARG